jgi:hypothetical protein
MPLTRCEISRKTPEQAMQTKVPTVKFTHCGSRVVQSAHFLLAGNRWRARITSSGLSSLRARERGVARRSEEEPGGANMMMIMIVYCGRCLVDLCGFLQVHVLYMWRCTCRWARPLRAKSTQMTDHTPYHAQKYRACGGSGIVRRAVKYPWWCPVIGHNDRLILCVTGGHFVCTAKMTIRTAKTVTRMN